MFLLGTAASTEKMVAQIQLPDETSDVEVTEKSLRIGPMLPCGHPDDCYKQVGVSDRSGSGTPIGHCGWCVDKKLARILIPHDMAKVMAERDDYKSGMAEANKRWLEASAERHASEAERDNALVSREAAYDQREELLDRIGALKAERDAAVARLAKLEAVAEAANELARISRTDNPCGEDWDKLFYALDNLKE